MKLTPEQIQGVLELEPNAQIDRLQGERPYIRTGYWNRQRDLNGLNTGLAKLGLKADEIDDLTGRIRHLTKAMKVMGIYAADEPSIERLLKEGNDGVLIPVKNWAAFVEKGGLQGAVQFMPLRDVAGALQQLYQSMFLHTVPN